MNPKQAFYEELRRQIATELREATTKSTEQQYDLVVQLVALIKQHEEQLNSLYFSRLLNLLVFFQNGAYKQLVHRLIKPEPTQEQEYIASVRQRTIAALLTQKASLQALEMVDPVLAHNDSTNWDLEFFFHQCPRCGSELCGCCGQCHMVNAREEAPRCPNRMSERENCWAWITASKAVRAVLNKDQEEKQDSHG